MELLEMNKDLSWKNVWKSQSLSRSLSKWVSLGLGIILISWLLAQLEWAETIQTLRNVPIPLVLLGFGCYALSFYLRALRFRLLLPTEKPLTHLFPIVLVHYTALNIIPARLGELSFVYLLKKVHDVTVGHSVSTLFLARIYDHVAISALFFLSLVFLPLSSEWLVGGSVVVGGFLLLTLVILVLLVAYKEQCVEGMKRIVRYWGLDRYRLSRRILDELTQGVDVLNTMKVSSHVSILLGISVLIWGSIFSVNFFLLRAFQIPLSHLEIVLASTFIILIRLIPFQFISGFGMHETIWTFIAMQFGVSRSVAITGAFGGHILATGFLGILGLSALFVLQKVLSQKTKHREDHS